MRLSSPLVWSDVLYIGYIAVLLPEYLSRVMTYDPTIVSACMLLCRWPQPRAYLLRSLPQRL